MKPPFSLETEAKHHLAWRRYLCPRGSKIPLDNFGFLADPENQIVSNLAQAEDRREPGCLVMLGEPGIGKSAELYAQYKKERSLSQPYTPNMARFTILL
jgi:hypothetical protein